jgi:hypothetical protein
MVFGSFEAGNFFALATGLVSVLVGYALLRGAAWFENAASKIQRQLGPLGRRAARAQRRWVTVLSAIVAIVIGALCIAAALLLKAQS